MTAAPPDLNDPAALAAYRRELRGVARPVRWMGVGLAVLAALIALAQRRWPHIPTAVPVFLLIVAAFHLLAGIVIRLHYHRRRMRG